MVQARNHLFAGPLGCPCPRAGRVTMRAWLDLFAVIATLAFLAAIIAGAIGPATASKSDGPDWPRDRFPARPLTD